MARQGPERNPNRLPMRAYSVAGHPRLSSHSGPDLLASTAPLLPSRASPDSSPSAVGVTIRYTGFWPLLSTSATKASDPSSGSLSPLGSPHVSCPHHRPLLLSLLSPVGFPVSPCVRPRVTALGPWACGAASTGHASPRSSLSLLRVTFIRLPSLTAIGKQPRLPRAHPREHLLPPSPRKYLRPSERTPGHGEAVHCPLGKGKPHRAGAVRCCLLPYGRSAEQTE